jgi:hypothetical protein
MSRKTKAEREAEKKLEEKRAKERERWHRRKLDKAYIKAKLESKAEWQRANPKKNLEYVQNFYERYGISGREARTLGKEGAASVSKGTTKPSRPSRKRDTGGKVNESLESASRPSTKKRQREASLRGQSIPSPQEACWLL